MAASLRADTASQATRVHARAARTARCCDALDLLAIPWRQSNHKTISVSTRAGVARLDELVGPKS